MKLMTEPSAVAITGKRGSGKTSLAYLLLDQSKYDNKIVVLPEPDSIAWSIAEKAGITPAVFSEDFIENMPEESIIMMDEASISLYARDSGKKVNKLMIKALAKSRQMDQSLLFISHDMAGLDIGVLRGCDTLFLKEPGHLNVSLDRTPFKKLVESTNTKFKKIHKSQRVKYVYVSNEDGEIMVKIGQAKFWHSDLSLPWKKCKQPTEQHTDTTPASVIRIVAESKTDHVEGVYKVFVEASHPLTVQAIRKKAVGNITINDAIRAINQLLDANLITTFRDSSPFDRYMLK